ncbi:MAG: MarR family transcriptional regulator, partial [Bacteroidota bacterium]
VVVRRRTETAVQRVGLTLQQFNVLRILRGADAPLPTMEVADRMVEPEPGITRLLGRLEAKGLVERSRCAEDGRRVLAGITEAGRAVLADADEPVDGLDETILGGLSDYEVDTLLSLLDRIRNHQPGD